MKLISYGENGCSDQSKVHLHGKYKINDVMLFEALNNAI
jgi:hypothetical protein